MSDLGDELILASYYCDEDQYGADMLAYAAIEADKLAEENDRLVAALRQIRDLHLSREKDYGKLAFEGLVKLGEAQTIAWKALMVQDGLIDYRG